MEFCLNLRDGAFHRSTTRVPKFPLKAQENFFSTLPSHGVLPGIYPDAPPSLR